jgi:quercetin dioxygenase-like cupin family protein
MPGHEPKPHQHAYEQIVYILDGEMDFHVGEEIRRVKAGELIVIPPNVMHHGLVVGDKPAFNLDVFTPRRPEYA